MNIFCEYTWPINSIRFTLAPTHSSSARLNKAHHILYKTTYLHSSELIMKVSYNAVSLRVLWGYSALTSTVLQLKVTRAVLCYTRPRCSRSEESGCVQEQMWHDEGEWVTWQQYSILILQYKLLSHLNSNLISIGRLAAEIWTIFSRSKTL